MPSLTLHQPPLRSTKPIPAILLLSRPRNMLRHQLVRLIIQPAQSHLCKFLPVQCVINTLELRMGTIKGHGQVNNRLIRFGTLARAHNLDVDGKRILFRRGHSNVDPDERVRAAEDEGEGLLDGVAEASRRRIDSVENMLLEGVRAATTDLVVAIVRGW